MSVIHLTAGQCLNDLLAQTYPEEHFVPFNEDFSKGSYNHPLFTADFLAERSAVHGVSLEVYRDNLAEFLALLPDFSRYDKVMLWFGEDDTCRANRQVLEILLVQLGYTGRIWYSCVQEETGRILAETELFLGESKG